MNIGKKLTMMVCIIPLAACGGGRGNEATDPVAYTITASAGTGGAINPTGNVAVPNGATQTFTVTPDTGYRISAVSSTCKGALNGNSYTTQTITANCSVEATFVQTAAGISISACFSAPKAVDFALSAYGSNGTPMPAMRSLQRRVGPATFDNQAATESTMTYTVANTPFSLGDYWTTTGNGVSMLGRLYDGSTYIANPPLIIPLNMQPGQSIHLASAAVMTANFDAPADYTFIGFETMNLADKTFPNTCHFQLQNLSPDASHLAWEEHWYAPGYGEVQSQYPSSLIGASPSVASGLVWGYRYAGDI